MKISVWMVIVGLVGFMGIWADASVTKELVLAAETEADCLDLLRSCDDAAQTNMVYSRIVFQLASSAGQRKAKAEAFGLRSDAIQLAEILDMPNGTARNQKILDALRLGNRFPALTHWFKPGYSSKAECIEAYELMLKNVPLNDQTKATLGRIKGELLKIKD